MKLNRIYSNKPSVFQPIEFVDGLNVVLGINRHPEAEGADAHNLGKTTLLRLLDFCLLKRNSQDIFLLKAGDIFLDFVFFLEIKLLNGKFLTIRRSVENPSKASFLLNDKGGCNFSMTPPEKWDHWEEGYTLSRNLLTSYLEWDIPEGCSYRNMMMYCLRLQEAYNDPVQFGQYIQKPYIWRAVLLNWLGLDGSIAKQIKDNSDKQEDLEARKNSLKEFLPESDTSKLEDLKKEITKLESVLATKQLECEELNYFHSDLSIISDLVEKIDKKLTAKKSVLYEIKSERRRLEKSLSKKEIKVDDEELFDFFERIRLFFPNSIKKSFSDLVKFNHDILIERRRYLKQSLINLEKQEQDNIEQVKILEQERAKHLALMQNADAQEQIGQLFSEVFKLHEQISLLRLRCEKREKFASLDLSSREKKKDEKILKEQLKTMLISAKENDNSVYNKALNSFSSIIMNVTGRSAAINVYLNNNAGLECKVEFSNDEGKDTYESDGNSYKKLLCIAFDMAMMSARSSSAAPHFMYHDGIFESLDNSKKIALMRELENYCASGMQHIITMIDSDIPRNASLDSFLPKDSKVILSLTAGNDDGLLFKGMKW